ncbi:DUF3037 family protein [Nocardioides albertanoniae]|uniref:DUF3037 family protein n=1 Tax=Nocardioides albertanoniae TaxID=1175486 RepID=A0A543A6E6_9ACTN|nr:DUF3037 domain-containing protein [Nocardioides albertanoniae]TQL68099.1 DUF3037 family protein [Nocardioides albertanoniae]
MDAYQYVVLRCVPRPEREEFLNVGVVLYCPEQKFLAARWALEEARLSAFAPDLDLAHVRAGLESIDLICAGTAHAGFGAGVRATAYGIRALVDNESARFGLLKAPKSTVLQPGPVHGGVTADAAIELDRVFTHQVG